MTPMPAARPRLPKSDAKTDKHGPAPPYWPNENTTGRRSSLGHDNPATTFSASPSSSSCDSHSGMLL